MKQLYSAGVVLYRERDDKRAYLLLCHPQGHWDFPKGKIEQGEHKKQAALRELYEETGLQATIIDGFEESLMYAFTDVNKQKAKKTVYFFVGKVLKDMPIRLSHEHVGHAWVDFDGAMQKLTFENAQTVLCKADEFLSSL